jgi:hypothetical protein
MSNVQRDHSASAVPAIDAAAILEIEATAVDPATDFDDPQRLIQDFSLIPVFHRSDGASFALGIVSLGFRNAGRIAGERRHECATVQRNAQSTTTIRAVKNATHAMPTQMMRCLPFMGLAGLREEPAGFRGAGTSRRLTLRSAGSDPGITKRTQQISQLGAAKYVPAG